MIKKEYVDEWDNTLRIYTDGDTVELYLITMSVAISINTTKEKFESLVTIINDYWEGKSGIDQVIQIMDSLLIGRFHVVIDSIGDSMGILICRTLTGKQRAVKLGEDLIGRYHISKKRNFMKN